LEISKTNHGSGFENGARSEVAITQERGQQIPGEAGQENGFEESANQAGYSVRVTYQEGIDVSMSPDGHSAAKGTRVAARSPEALLNSYIASDIQSLRMLDQIRRVAASASTMLIRGESGTGKDLAASLVHYLGPNLDEPLIKIDCASLPPDLIESELFGFERGAFTGATQMKRGRMEMAGSGTLVLDEIAALGMTMQAKLLRAIEDKHVERLGGHRPVAIRARIIALTNVDLERAVAQRRFREDLFYRLNVIPLMLTPLRERRADVAPLAQHFADQFSEVHRKSRVSFSPSAMAALEQYAFPGNVRELRNIVERAVVLGRGDEISLQDLPAAVRQAGGSGAQARMSLEDVERAYIAEILDFTRGKKSKAAEILGISRKTLLEKRKKYRLD
jgi:two-component system response regulator AtoC